MCLADHTKVQCDGQYGLALQVLIFSQFKIMLNVLEDYLRLMKFPLERIDGSVSQRDRELAINRYSAGLDNSTCPALHLTKQLSVPAPSVQLLVHTPQKGHLDSTVQTEKDLGPRCRPFLFIVRPV